MPSWRRRFAIISSVLGLSLALATVPAAVSADDDDGEDDRFGAWIHTGTPDDFAAEPVANIGGLEVLDDDDDDDDDFRWFDLGSIDAGTIFEEEDDIDTSLDALTAEPHVVVVTATGSSDSDVLAVGRIAGDLDERGNLTIALEPVDGSGFAGLAHFDPDDDDDDDDLDVQVVFWEGEPAVASTPAS